MVLDEVEYLNIDFNRLNIYFDRMSSRYKKSYEVALMILNKLVPITDSSDKKSFAFLFRMYEVFELFVGKLYQEIDKSTQLQVEKNYGNLKLKPDIVIENMIIDTKYKIFDEKGLSRDDKYQMYVYGKNFAIKDTVILYPKHLEDINKNLELGEGEEMVGLGLRSLDLWVEGGYDEFVGEIRNRLEKLK